jgi:hypothetical protein
MFPPLIEWSGALHPAQMLTSSGAHLIHLSVLHPQADVLSDLLGGVAGATVRFETAQAPKLVAEFSTPHGTRLLI